MSDFRVGIIPHNSFPPPAQTDADTACYYAYFISKLKKQYDNKVRETLNNIFLLRSESDAIRALKI